MPQFFFVCTEDLIDSVVASGDPYGGARPSSKLEQLRKAEQILTLEARKRQVSQDEHADQIAIGTLTKDLKTALCNNFCLIVNLFSLRLVSKSN